MATADASSHPRQDHPACHASRSRQSLILLGSGFFIFGGLVIVFGWCGTLAVLGQAHQKSMVVFRASNAWSWVAGTLVSPQARVTRPILWPRLWCGRSSGSSGR